MRTLRWRRLVPLSLGIGLLMGAVHGSASGIFGHDRWNWAEFTAYFGAWTVFTPLLAWWQRWLVRRQSAESHWAMRNRRWREENLAPVLRSGVLPVGIDRKSWRSALRDERQELEAGVWGSLGANLVIAGLTAVAAIVANDNAWTVWAVALVIAGQGALGARLLWPQLRAARRLLAELSDRRVEP